MFATASESIVVCRVNGPTHPNPEHPTIHSKLMWSRKCPVSVLGRSLLTCCPETPHLQTSISCQCIDPASPATMGPTVAVTVARAWRPTHVRCTPVQSLRPGLLHGDVVSSHRRKRPPAWQVFLNNPPRMSDPPQTLLVTATFCGSNDEEA
jgi:hypothetical protein